MAGLTSSRSSPSLREDSPTYLIPSCYASHKALSKTYLRAPGLFTGQGMRLLGEMEKYRPAEMRNQSLNSKAYLRRQLLLPEAHDRVPLAMGLETSCLVQPGPGAPRPQGGYTSTGCFIPGNSCMTPGNVCMRPPDVRNVKQGDGQVKAHVLRRVPCEVLESLSKSGVNGVNANLEVRYASAEEACKAARKLAAGGDMQQALIAYSQALDWDEKLGGPKYLFTRALSLEPHNAQYCYRQGVVLQQQKQLKQAAQSFTAALQQNPRFLGALFNLGIVHKELGETRRAAEQFQKLLQINAEDPCALALLGECQADLGDFEGAVRSLEDAVRLDPQNRSAQKDLLRLRQQVSEGRNTRPRPEDRFTGLGRGPRPRGARFTAQTDPVPQKTRIVFCRFQSIEHDWRIFTIRRALAVCFALSVAAPQLPLMTVHGTASPPWNLMELNMEPHGAPKLLGSRVNPNGFEIILRRQELKSFESQKLSRPEVEALVAGALADWVRDAHAGADAATGAARSACNLGRTVSRSRDELSWAPSLGDSTFDFPQAIVGLGGEGSTISGAILSPQYGPGNAASRAHRKDKAQRSLSLSSLRPTSEMSAARLLDIKMLRSNSRPHTRILRPRQMTVGHDAPAPSQDAVPIDHQDRALHEIHQGRKSSCWMWFVIPTPPHIVNGVERGSSMNRKFALRDEEAKAFLSFEADGNYLKIMTAVRDQLKAGRAVASLMGTFDAPKLTSSVALFERMTCDGSDDELYQVLREIKRFLP
eukprot:g4280.t1